MSRLAFGPRTEDSYLWFHLAESLVSIWRPPETFMPPRGSQSVIHTERRRVCPLHLAQCVQCDWKSPAECLRQCLRHRGFFSCFLGWEHSRHSQCRFATATRVCVPEL